MQRGYIKIWRKLEDSGLIQMHGTLSLFMVMLFRAAYKPSKIGLVEVDRGQLIAGRFQLCEWAGLSEQSVRTSLKHLHDMEILTSKSTNKFTIYTIVNYGQYQDSDDATNQQTNQQLTNNQPTTNQQLTTIKELNNLNIKEKKQYSSAEFDKFWEAWPKSPRKGAKSNCLRVWENRKLNNEIDSILAHVQYCKNNGVWKDPQFISAPLVYLNQSKWDGAEIGAKPNQPFSMDNFMRQVNGK